MAKYDFKGIKQLGVAQFRVALASQPTTAWMLKFGGILDLLLEFVTNWLANRGLIVLNVGAVFVEGRFEQLLFDRAMDDAFKKITAQGGRDKLTEAQKKAIDDEVILAARRFILLR